jgi:hypothetical protein
VTPEACGHEVSSARFWPGGFGAHEAMSLFQCMFNSEGFAERAGPGHEAHHCLAAEGYDAPARSRRRANFGNPAKLLVLAASGYEADDVQREEGR